MSLTFHFFVECESPSLHSYAHHYCHSRCGIGIYGTVELRKLGRVVVVVEVVVAVVVVVVVVKLCFVLLII
jgi:hypothetical protein